MKKVVFVGLVSLCWADTFYVKEHKEDVRLVVTDINYKTKVYLLKSDANLTVSEYEKICLKKTKKGVEIAIKESDKITLKNSSLCHNFKLFPKLLDEKESWQKVVLKFKLLLDTLTYSGVKELASLSGKGADVIEVSKRKYPNLELDFSEISNVNKVNFFKNGEPMQLKKNSKLFFRKFSMDDSIVIQVKNDIGEVVGNSFEFKIIE